MRDRIRRKGPGRYRVKLRSNEQLLVRELIGQLREQLLVSTDEPHLQRLFPPAYPDDVERDAGYQVLTRDELVERKLAALEVVDRTVGGGDVTEEELGAWMLALNSLRLVLGTRLDVDETIPLLDPDDPEAFAYAVYEYLGELLHQVVVALGDDLPPPSTPDAPGAPGSPGSPGGPGSGPGLGPEPNAN